jgi:hypothetical protein
MSTTISKSCTAVDQTSNELAVRNGETFSYAVSGTFVGTVVIEQKNNRGRGPGWTTLLTATGSASGYLVAEEPGKQFAIVRVRCTAYTSGTIVTSISDQTRKVNQVVGGGIFTTAGGSTTESIPVPGILAGDTCVVWVRKAGGTPRTVDAAVPGTEVITVTMSGDASTDHSLAYLVLRAAA